MQRNKKSPSKDICLRMGLDAKVDRLICTPELRENMTTGSRERCSFSSTDQEDRRPFWGAPQGAG
ncbi:MAG: hypothetical protein D3910_21810 [Candidatus Electrothrix sp. ATG2]|nr:hypothetical protein [Candidatus Electrothrix sp. ATG2]